MNNNCVGDAHTEGGTGGICLLREQGKPPNPFALPPSPNSGLSKGRVKYLYLDKNVNIFLTKGIEKTNKICYNYCEKMFIEFKNKERNKDD